MRTIIIILATLLTTLLTSCAALEYSKLPLSSATVSDILVKSQDAESVVISFKYSIDDYLKNEGLYSCRIVFPALQYDTTASVRKPGTPHCEIDKQSGTLEYSSKIPEDNQYFSFPSPRKVFIGIYQKTGFSRTDAKLIGKSEVVKLQE